LLRGKGDYSRHTTEPRLYFKVDSVMRSILFCDTHRMSLTDARSEQSIMSC
jgi:hypothetical protein